MKTKKNTYIAAHQLSLLIGPMRLECEEWVLTYKELTLKATGIKIKLSELSFDKIEFLTNMVKTFKVMKRAAAGV